jgi:hypothetical protein
MTEAEIEAAIKDACELLLPVVAYGDLGEWGSYYWPARMLIDGDYPLDDANERRDWLISEALAGSRFAHDALCRVACELTEVDEPLPPWLQRYVVRAAKEGKARAARGRRLRDNLERDKQIAHAAFVIAVRYSLHPTRNVATADCAATESGCSIVVKAFERLGTALTESAVNRIWNAGGGPELLKREQAMTTAFGPNL